MRGCLICRHRSPLQVESLAAGVGLQQSSALQADSLPAEPPGSPRILEWVTYPFSSRSSQPRNRKSVSCMSGGFFTNWAIREAPQFTKAFQNQFIIWFSSVQLFSHVRLCDPMDCSMPGLPVHHQLQEFTQTHVHWVGNAIQPFHPLYKWGFICC